MFCAAQLSVDVSGSVIEFDYGFVIKTGFVVAGTSQSNTATMSTVTTASAGYYTCTVTITANGVCGNGQEQVCPTKTSDTISLGVLCEYVCVCVVFTHNKEISQIKMDTYSSWIA